MDITPQALVRSFSDDIQDRMTSGVQVTEIERIVAASTLTSQPEASQETAAQDASILQRADDRLQKAFDALRAELPEDQSQDLVGASFEDVLKAVEAMAENWETRRNAGALGKASKFLRASAKKLKSNSALLGVIPDQSHYTSLVAGVLKGIINATVNHENVAAFFSEALSQILEDVSFCHDRVRLFDTVFMRVLMVDFYCKVFVFLRIVVGWYKKGAFKRGFLAFNDNIVNDFQKPLDEISKCRQKVNDQMGLLQAATIKAQADAARRAAEELANIYRLLDAGQDAKLFADCVTRLEAQQIARSEVERRLLEETRVVEARNMAMLGSFQILSDKITSSLARLADERMSQTQERPLLSIEPVGSGSIVEELNLAQYYDASRLEYSYNANDVSFPVVAISPLRDWISSPSSRILSIAGPSHRSNDMASIAAKIADLALASKLPVVRYFCRLERSEQPQMIELKAVVYALADQCLELWPRTGIELPDVSDTSIDDALKVLALSLQHLPGEVFCIIDGYQLLQSSATDDALGRLLAVLRGGMTAKTHLKVLLTTAGRCRELMRALNREELVLADDRMAWDGGQYIGF